MKTKKEIILETVEYYKTHPRSLFKNGESCLYNGADGSKCAFSRCCIDSSQFPEFMSASYILDRDGESVLKEEYRGHEYKFWNDVQLIHDGSAYWNGNVLTARGQELMEHLLTKYNENQWKKTFMN